MKGLDKEIRIFTSSFLFIYMIFPSSLSVLIEFVTFFFYFLDFIYFLISLSIFHSPSMFFSCFFFSFFFLHFIYIYFSIKGFRTIVFIFIVISTTFRPTCPPAFFKYLLNSGTFRELRTTYFLESTGVACSDSVSYNRVQVLSIPV